MGKLEVIISAGFSLSRVRTVHVIGRNIRCSTTVIGVNWNAKTGQLKRVGPTQPLDNSNYSSCFMSLKPLKTIFLMAKWTV